MKHVKMGKLGSREVPRADLLAKPGGGEIIATLPKAAKAAPPRRGPQCVHLSHSVCE